VRGVEGAGEDAVLGHAERPRVLALALGGAPMVCLRGGRH
jgi:hypothetical protein